MPSSINSIIPLLAAAGILLAGNGFQGTLLTMRAEAEGFSLSAIGAMGTSYFLGFLVGTWQVTRLIEAVGHIRVFASLAALAAAGALLFAIFISTEAWIVLRFLSGFCFAGLFTVVESWLNGAAKNKDRGQVLSIYRLVDLGAVTGSQIALPFIGIGGFQVFSVMAILLCVSLVPIALSRRGAPKIKAGSFKFDLRAVWNISPLAVTGVFAIGLTTSAFRMVGPAYASNMGLDVADVAYFMAAGIVGGAALQYPLGLLSDRFDRRWVLIFATLCASATGLVISNLPNPTPKTLFAAIFIFGAFALPLYSLSVAHANDHAKDDQFALLSAGLIFVYSLGAVVGPLGASLVIERFGAPAFFAYVGCVHAALVMVTLLRMRARTSVPRDERGKYVPLLRTSPAFLKLAKKSLNPGMPAPLPISPSSASNPAAWAVQGYSSVGDQLSASMSRTTGTAATSTSDELEVASDAQTTASQAPNANPDTTPELTPMPHPGDAVIPWARKS